MNRFIRVAAALVALTACSAGAPESHSMVPRTCAEPPWDHLTPQATIDAPRGTEVGITIGRGRGDYRLVDAFVEVLRPDAVLDPENGIAAHANPSLLDVSAAPGPAADRRVAITWQGVDRDGVPLPPGEYPVVFALDTRPAGRCTTGGGFLVSGVLATLDWKG